MAHHAISLQRDPLRALARLLGLARSLARRLRGTPAKRLARRAGAGGGGQCARLPRQALHVIGGSDVFGVAATAAGRRRRCALKRVAAGRCLAQRRRQLCVRVRAARAACGSFG
eukprot:366503-Chlamydomonas_euryale.AAC.7